MSVQFVIGRAGSGKTHFCLESIRRRLVAEPVAGPALVCLVPEQAALQMERALIDVPALGGAHRAMVCGFRRLADRIIHSTAPAAPPVISPLGRTMVLRLLLGRLAGRLQCYRRLERLTGFIDQMSDTIGELFEEAVHHDDLVRAASESAADPLRAAKLADLHLLYAAYLQYLGAERLDPSQHLDLARSRVAQCTFLAGAEIWIDGFAGLTRQEMHLLVELSRHAAHATITVMVDPQQAARAVQVEPFELFSKTLRTYLKLRDALAAAGLEFDETIEQNGPPPRFAACAVLAQLERSVFDETSAHSTGEAHASPPPMPPGASCAQIGIFELPDRRLEVDFAVARVQRWVQRPANPLRYRDIALIVRDLEPYHDLLSAALADRGIPFFIDRRRPTAHHPLVELLRGMVRLVSDDMPLETVRAVLKTGLTDLTDHQADELENFLLANGVAGSALWHGPDWAPLPPDDRISRPDRAPAELTQAERDRIARINNARQKFLSGLREWLALAGTTGAMTGRQWAVAVAKALIALGVPENLARWSEASQQAGDLDKAEEHRQIWRETCEFFEDMAEALSGESMAVAELAGILDAGLARFTLGLTPPMLDQVLVGAIERSRHPEIKAAVVLGFSDDVFPVRAQESAILNDDDREFLAGRNVEIAAPARRRTLEDRTLAYVALTRPSQALVITYPTHSSEGEPLRPSTYLAEVVAAVPGLAIQRVDDPQRSRSDWAVLSDKDLASAVPLEFRNRPADPADDDPQIRARWNGVYETIRSDDRFAEVLGRGLAGLAFVNQAALSAESVRRLIPSTLQASVSRLETFATCPFKHFAQYSLKLEERKLADLAVQDFGKLHHAILEDFIKQLIERHSRPGDLDEPALLCLLDESCRRISIRPPLAGAPSHAREAYLTARAAAELGAVLQSQRNVSARGKFRPRGTEVAYGFDTPGSLPALQVETPAGRLVQLRGYIDRVDVAEMADELLGIVIDYKRTRDRKLDLASVYHGLSLQLIAYLLVLAQQGKSLAGRAIRPIGAFYVRLLAAYEPVDHPSDYKPDEASRKRFLPRGLLDVNAVTALDAEAGSGKSFVCQAELKGQKINYENRSDAYYPQDFTALLEHTRRRMGELADRILDGDASVAPYRLGHTSPCGWCEYRSLCRFEFGASQLRFLEKHDRAEILHLIRRPAPDQPS